MECTVRGGVALQAIWGIIITIAVGYPLVARGEEPANWQFNPNESALGQLWNSAGREGLGLLTNPGDTLRQNLDHQRDISRMLDCAGQELAGGGCKPKDQGQGGSGQGPQPPQQPSQPQAGQQPPAGSDPGGGNPQRSE